jgi:hypothetical protein
MTAAILSQDFLGICLVLSDGNLDTRLADIIERVERFQQAHNRHFGISRTDFSTSLFRLTKGGLSDGFEIMMRRFERMMLKDVVMEILGYEKVYCNDEGEYWDLAGEPDEYDCSYVQSLLDLLGFREVDYRATQAMKRSMLDFFRNAENSSKIESVKEFMTRNGITHDLLYRCSRGGDSS